MYGKILWPKKKRINKGLLKRNLDIVVSKIVRARDKHCVICGSTYQLTAGHVFSRKSLSTRWDLMNVHAQCWDCNLKHNINSTPYYDWFIKKFGQAAFVELEVRYHEVSYDSGVVYWQELLVELREELKKYE